MPAQETLLPSSTNILVKFEFAYANCADGQGGDGRGKVPHGAVIVYQVIECSGRAVSCRRTTSYELVRVYDVVRARTGLSYMTFS